MPFLILSILVQVAFVVHIVKTGRNTTWIWIVVMLPMAGSLAYLILEVFPELSQSRSGRRAGKKIESVINPNKDFDSAARQFVQADNIDNAMMLASECLNKSKFEDAKALYMRCLQGIYADDPHLLLGLSKAEFGLGNYQAVIDVLDDLIESNPEFKDAYGHLIYARSLQALGRLDEARDEYDVLYHYFSGPDAAYFYADFLGMQGQEEKSQQIFKEIVEKADMSAKSYREMHAKVIKQAKERCK